MSCFAGCHSTTSVRDGRSKKFERNAKENVSGRTYPLPVMWPSTSNTCGPQTLKQGVAHNENPLWPRLAVVGHYKNQFCPTPTRVLVGQSNTFSGPERLLCPTVPNTCGPQTHHETLWPTSSN